MGWNSGIRENLFQQLARALIGRTGCNLLMEMPDEPTGDLCPVDDDRLKILGIENIVKHVLMPEAPAAHQKADHAGPRLIRQG